MRNGMEWRISEVTEIVKRIDGRFVSSRYANEDTKNKAGAKYEMNRARGCRSVSQIQCRVQSTNRKRHDS